MRAYICRFGHLLAEDKIEFRAQRASAMTPASGCIFIGPAGWICISKFGFVFAILGLYLQLFACISAALSLYLQLWALIYKFVRVFASLGLIFHGWACICKSGHVFTLLGLYLQAWA